MEDNTKHHSSTHLGPEHIRCTAGLAVQVQKETGAKMNNYPHYIEHDSDHLKIIPASGFAKVPQWVFVVNVQLLKMRKSVPMG